jgi:hypothetical protein
MPPTGAVSGTREEVVDLLDDDHEARVRVLEECDGSLLFNKGLPDLRPEGLPAGPLQLHVFFDVLLLDVARLIRARGLFCSFVKKNNIPENK